MITAANSNNPVKIQLIPEFPNVRLQNTAGRVFKYYCLFSCLNAGLETLPLTNPTLQPHMNPHSFLESHSRAIRIWHWTFVLLITATIATVLLASTVFRTRNTISLVQQQLQQKGVTVSEDQARAVSHEFNDQLWDIHRLIGFGLCALLLSRWFIDLSEPRGERLQVRLRKALGYRSTIPIEMIQRRHYVNVKATYLVFYTVMA